MKKNTNIHKTINAIYTVLACVLFTTVVRGQDIKCDNVIIDGDTITTRIFIYEYPTTEEQFKYLLNKIGDEIKFKDDTWNGVKFWLYVSIINDINHYTDFKQAFEKLVGQMNRWLRDEYGQYAR